MSMMDYEENGVVNACMQQLLQMMRGENECLDRFSPTFHEFIRKNPPKDEIKLVSREIKERINEAHKFKPVADSFVELMSLFALELKEAAKGKGVSESN
jgi:hypothetical protein